MSVSSPWCAGVILHTNTHVAIVFNNRNYPSFPKGSVEKTDVSIPHAAARELKEETKFVVDPAALRDHVDEMRGKQCIVRYYFHKVPKVCVLDCAQDDEIVRVEWVSINELQNLNWKKSRVGTVAQLTTMLADYIT